MNHKFPWEDATRPAKALAVSMIFSMAGFAGVMWGISNFVERHHPDGAELYVLAALPSIPIFSVMLIFGIYLRKEEDEFQRFVMVKSMLWAIAVTLGVSWFTGMLRGVGGMRSSPPFLEFAVFWIAFGAAQAVQVIANRVKQDD